MKKILFLICLFLSSSLAYAETETIELGLDMNVYNCDKSSPFNLCAISLIPGPTPVDLRKTISDPEQETWIGSWNKAVIEDGIIFLGVVDIEKQVTKGINGNATIYRIQAKVFSDIDEVSNPTLVTKISFWVPSLLDIFPIDLTGTIIKKDNKELIPVLRVGRPLRLDPTPSE